jgi:purine nucleosidase
VSNLSPEVNCRLRRPGVSLPDPVAMAVALDPGVVTRKSRHPWTWSEGVLTRGMTVVDQLDVARRGVPRRPGGPPASREPNVTVCWEIDVPSFRAFFEALA